MIFGIPEMKAFAEGHEDPRVVAIWLRFEESRRKNAEWCDKSIRLRERVKELVEGIKRHRKWTSFPTVPDQRLWELIDKQEGRGRDE